MVKIEKILYNWEKWAKITNFVIFEPFQHVILQKKAFFTQDSISNRKIMVCLKENWKKLICLFSDKIDADLLSTIANFSNLCSKVWKVSSSVLLKGLKLKVTKGELNISNHLETADRYIQWWLPVPPPNLIRAYCYGQTWFDSTDLNALQHQSLLQVSYAIGYTIVPGDSFLLFHQYLVQWQIFQCILTYWAKLRMRKWIYTTISACISCLSILI